MARIRAERPEIL